MRTRTTAILLATGLLAGSFALSACSSSSDSATTESASAVATPAASALVIADPTVRVTDDISPVSEETGKLMTGVFMTITNNSDQEVSLIGGSSPVAGKVEIHEVVDGAMVPKSGGVPIPAQGNQIFRMGGYHVMLLDLAGPINAGDEVPVTLEFSDGTTQVVTASARTIAMDDEKYGPDMAGEGMSEEGMIDESKPHTHAPASASSMSSAE